MTHAQESTSTEGTSAADSGAAVPMATEELDDEEALLQQALMMSMQEDAEAASASVDTNTEASTGAQTAGGDMVAMVDVKPSPEDAEVVDEEEEALRLALEMSMAGDAAEESAASSAPMDQSSDAAAEDDDVAAMMADPEFLQSLYGDLPGVDMADARIQDVLNQATQEDGASGDGEAKKE
jgi:hypothetical protein